MANKRLSAREFITMSKYSGSPSSMLIIMAIFIVMSLLIIWLLIKANHDFLTMIATVFIIIGSYGLGNAWLLSRLCKQGIMFEESNLANIINSLWPDD